MEVLLLRFHWKPESVASTFAVGDGGLGWTFDCWVEVMPCWTDHDWPFKDGSFFVVRSTAASARERGARLCAVGRTNHTSRELIILDDILAALLRPLDRLAVFINDGLSLICRSSLD